MLIKRTKGKSVAIAIQAVILSMMDSLRVLDQVFN